MFHHACDRFGEALKVMWVALIIISQAMSVVCCTGTYLGNKTIAAERVWVDAITSTQLASANSQSDPTTLAGALLHLLFAPEELRIGNATPARTAGVVLLDGHRLNAIRGMFIGVFVGVMTMINVC